MTNRTNLLVWAGISLLLFFEFFLFRTYVLREIAPYYPKSYDQASYLSSSYALYENMLERGRIIKHLLYDGSLPQTALFHKQAALFFLIFGASRLSALTINFFYFALLQLALFLTLKKIANHYRYGFIAIGIMLATNTVYLASDFRIDFIAACLYGIWCFAVLWSGVFLSRRWTLISLGIATFLILMRYLTACYVMGVMGVLFVYALLSLFRNSDNRAINSLRLRHIILFCVSLLVLISPVIWLNHDMLYHYYVVGHVTGAEKLMRLKYELQATHTAYPLLYYPKAFFSSHFSPVLLEQLGIISIIYLVFMAYHRSLAKMGEIARRFSSYFLFLLVSIFVPLFVLTMDVSKSPLVISVIIGPFVCLLTLVFALCSETCWLFSAGQASRWLNRVTVLFLLIGCYGMAAHLSRVKGHDNLYDKDFAVTKMVDDIGQYAASKHLKTVYATSDYLDDFINAPIAPFYYERHGALFVVQTLSLGNNGMTPITEKQAMDSLVQADMFTMNMDNYQPDNIFPFESSIMPFRKKLQAYAEKNMTVLGEYTVGKTRLRVYVKS